MSEKMTKERLKKLSSLNREIERTQKRLDAMAASQTGGKRHDAAVSKAESALEKYHAEAEAEAACLINYIESISDAHLREIFMLRYYDGIRSWQRIAFLAGDHDESYVRRMHDRYLRG